MNIIKESSEYSVYKLSNLIDATVAELDPLGWDKGFMNEFPFLSQTGDTSKMLNLLDKTFSSVGYQNIISMSALPAMAVTRDLSMLASSLNRWGVKIASIPLLEPVLLKLGEVSSELPVDTVYTYGPRNPKGENQRRFTMYSEERIFIDSFVSGMRHLPVCIAGLEILQSLDLLDPEYANICEEVVNHFSEMVKNIVVVRKQISPEVFTHSLRPFFEPKIIGGKKYFAPGGAQMPICLMDLILWGVDCNEISYVRYWNESTQYLPKAYRNRIGKIMVRPSIALQVSRCSSLENPIAQNSIKGLVSILLGMEKFRQPHLKIAKENMAIRPTNSVGSGGYDLEILEYLLLKTKTERLKLEDSVL